MRQEKKQLEKDFELTASNLIQFETKKRKVEQELDLLYEKKWEKEECSACDKRTIVSHIKTKQGEISDLTVKMIEQAAIQREIWQKQELINVQLVEKNVAKQTLVYNGLYTEFDPKLIVGLFKTGIEGTSPCFLSIQI